MIKLRRKQELEDISSASMSDVAFLLLVFFMVASVFYVKEGLSSRLPKRNSAPVLVLRENVYRFTVQQQSIRVAHVRLGSKNYKSLGEFRTGLSQMKIPDLPKKYALLLSANGSTVQDMTAVLAAVRSHGFKRISIQRRKK